jgi:hypothetical protein
MRRLGAKEGVDAHDCSALPARRATSADQCFDSGNDDVAEISRNFAKD